jgi:hypothetical protein
MKKFGIILFIAVFCVAFAMPAMSATRFGGSVGQSVNWDTDDENYQRNNKGRAMDGENTQFSLGGGYNSKIHFYYNNSKKTLGAQTGLNFMSENFQTQIPPEGTRSRYLFGWWQANDKIKFSVGQQDVVFGGYSSPENDYSLSGFGNTEPDRERGIRMDMKFTKKVSASVGIFRGQKNGTVAVKPDPAATPETLWSSNDEEVRGPRWDFALNVRVEKVSVKAGYFTGEQNYDYDLASSSLAENADNKIAFSGLNIGAMRNFGKFQVQAEYNQATNLTNSSLQGGFGIKGSPRAEFDNVGGTWKVADAEMRGMWASVKYTGFEKFSLAAYYGAEETEMDRIGTENDWKFYRTKTCFVLSWQIQKQMGVSHEYSVRDRGTAQVGPGAAASQRVTNGDKLGKNKHLGIISFFMMF